MARRQAAQTTDPRWPWRFAAAHGRKDELTMALITRSQVINAPVDEVFDVIVDGANFAAWNPTVRSSRRLDSGQVGNGTRFEWELRGFSRPERVRIVPHIKTLAGGHRFLLTSQGDMTCIDHELEMRPKGAFWLFAPMMGSIGRKNLRDTANALQARLNRGHVYKVVYKPHARGPFSVQERASGLVLQLLFFGL